MGPYGPAGLLLPVMNVDGVSDGCRRDDAAEFMGWSSGSSACWFCFLNI